MKKCILLLTAVTLGLAGLVRAQDTKECTQKIPPHRMMYRRLTADSSWAYTIDSTTYPTVFAIIEIDTVGLPYDTSLFSCPVPEALTLRSRGDYWVRIEWVDNSNNAEWMVSVAPIGENPDNGRMIPSNDRNLHIYGLSPDTSYNIYVRGACTTSMWEGWSDWSAPLTLEATHTPEGISAPVCERVSLNPNPARGTVTVTTESQQGTLTIIDMQGRQMLTMPLAGSETVVDIHTLAPGTYVVTLNTPQGHSSLKLTVE